MRSTLSLAIVATLVSGCASAPRYAYRPAKQAVVEDAPGDLDGVEAAAYDVATRGDVRVAAVGFTKMRLPEGVGWRRVQTLHVRMMVHNGGREVWTINTTAQKAVIDGGSREAPLSAVCDGDAGVSTAVLMPGDTRTVDLYYELPKEVAGAAALPVFRVDWRIEGPSGLIAARTTPFERHDVTPPPVPVVPADPNGLARKLQPSPGDDGMPQPGRVESIGWPSWRD